MSLIIVHLTETDGDIVVKKVSSWKKELKQYIEDNKLCECDYALIEGEIRKDFDDDPPDMEIK